MNEKLERLRQRIFGASERTEPVKVLEWMGFAISLFALAVSGASLYYSNIRTEIRPQFIDMEGYTFGRSLLAGASGFDISEGTTLVFVNGGNQSFAVLKATISIFQSSAIPKGSECPEMPSSARFIFTDFRPISVKEKDVLTVPVRLVEKNDYEPAIRLKDGTFKFDVSEAEKKNPTHLIYICIGFTTATPNGPYSVLQRIATYDLAKHKFDRGDDSIKSIKVRSLIPE